MFIPIGKKLEDSDDLIIDNKKQRLNDGKKLMIKLYDRVK